MKTEITSRIAISVIALAALIAPVASRAEVESHSKQIVVLQPGDLPQQAQIDGEGLFLHSDSNGTYLYVAQKQGALLTVLDVTDPAHIKVASTVSLETSGPFDFMEPLNNRAELIRYRDNGRVAILDLKKAKRPTVHNISSMDDPEIAQPIGVSGFLAKDEPFTYSNTTASDFQVVDVSTASNPVLMTTIKQVQQRVVNNETGTTFLLGSDGLTVIRQPEVEKEKQAEDVQLNHN
jgi:LVIVD repeat